MSNNILYMGILWVMGLSIGIAKPAPEDLSFLVVKGAQNVKVNTFFDKKRTQVIYHIPKEYPNLAVGKEKWKILENNGWRKCVDKNPGWSKFRDSISNKDRLVKRYIKYWIKGNKMLTVSMEFTSLGDGQENKNIEKKDSQRVVILMDKYENLRKITNKLGLDCSKK